MLRLHAVAATDLETSRLGATDLETDPVNVREAAASGDQTDVCIAVSRSTSGTRHRPSVSHPLLFALGTYGIAFGRGGEGSISIICQIVSRL